MIKIEIDIRSNEIATLKVKGKPDDISLEFFEIFEKLDENCQAIFRAAVFAYINTNEDMRRDFERVSENPLSKILTSIIRDNEDLRE